MAQRIMRRLKGSNGNPDLDRARVADLEEIGQFISKDNPPAAEKVGSRIIREAENVAAFPRLGRIVPEFGNPQIREIISQSYRVIYKFDEEGDLVYQV
jgi:toxin ParE1/3/4